MGGYRFVPSKPLSSRDDQYIGLIVSIVLLWGIGMCTLYVCSGSVRLVQRQLIASAIGFAGLLFFAIVPLSNIRRLLPIIMLVTFALLLCVFLPGIGREIKGTYRWIAFSSLRFQPSELAKFAIILYLANFFDKYQRKSNLEDRSLFPAIVVMVVFFGLILAGRDFSTGLFFIFLCLLLFVISGIKLLWIIPVSVIGLPALVMTVLSKDYRVERIMAWIRPDDYADGFNFQKNASIRAINFGGFWGSGIGPGISRLGKIPEVQSDFIFAGWTETMGFIGVVLYFAILIAFAYKAFRCALSCPDRFGAVGTFGCASAIFFQSLVHVSIVSGAVPTTGIPLPFFSAGGSSIVITLCMCGFILNAARTNYDDFSFDDYDAYNMGEVIYE